MTVVIAFAICLFALLAVLSAKFGLHTLEYRPESLAHKLLVIMFTGVCLGVSVWIFHILFKQSLPYPFEKDLAGYNAYEQLFDAFMKRQLNIDVEPAQELSLMLNPYNWEARDEAGFYYLWDRAFFDGRYFCYFGPAPVLLIYFPFYFLTETVPSPQTVCFIMSAVSVCVISALCVKVFRLFLEKVNLVLLLLSVLTVNFGSLVFMVQASADMYYTAVQSGILFLSLFLLTTLTAYEKKSYKLKCLMFLLSALSLVLLVLSRPNMALFAAMGVPIYLSVIFSKEFSVGQKTAQVLSFALPLVLGAALVMGYNYARFGSVLEFGASYQLTVHDVREYKLSPALLLPALYYYFAKLPSFSDSPPYLNIDFVNIIKDSGYDGYVYLTSTVGALSLPCNMLSFAAVPLCLARRDRVRTGFVLSGFVCAVVLAFADTCLGGVNIRYLADIMLVMTLLSVLMIAELANGLQQTRIPKLPVYLAAAAVLLLSVAVGALLILNNERDYIYNLYFS